MRKKTLKFLGHVRRKNSFTGVVMIVGDILFQNGGFFTMYFTRYHVSHVTEFANRVGVICRHIMEKPPTSSL